MNKKDYGSIIESISKISPHIRFAGIIGRTGRLMAYYRRPNLDPMLDARNTKYQFSHIMIKSDLESVFDKSLGEVQFVWEERKKVQIISFAIKRVRIWVSIDKKVVRSEVLRIIDACLPVVKTYAPAAKN